MRNCSEKTTGTIVYIEKRMEKVNQHLWKAYYYPVCLYEAAGNMVSGIGKKGATNPMYYQLHSQHAVKYNPANPEQCIIDGKTESGIGEIVLFCAGIFMLLV